LSRRHHRQPTAFSASIAEKGLVKGNRHHVHLSADIETARRVAVRRKGPWVIYRVDAARMTDDSHLFFLSANGVWLTDGVPPGFLAELPDIDWTPAGG
jgi:putative RNA 2'-phosphotransferase